MQLSEFFLIAQALKLSGTKNITWNNEKSELKNQKSEKNLELKQSEIRLEIIWNQAKNNEKSD